MTDATRCSRSHCPGAIGPDASPDCSGGSSLPFRAVPQREVPSVVDGGLGPASFSTGVVTRKWDYPNRRGPGRPPTAAAISKLVIRVATDHPTSGHRCVQGEFVKLGHTIAGSSVWRILHAAGIDPAPRRTAPPPPLSAWFPTDAAALGLSARAAHPGVVEEAPARHA